ENCVAFGNGAHGFTDNGNQSGIVLKNCTSFNNSAYSGSNCANFQMNRESGGKNSNLLSVATNKIATDGFIGTVTNSIYYNGGKYYEVGDTETFAGKEKIGNIVTVSADDFVSLDVPAYTNNFHEVWRKADGSIDMGTFLAIKETSALANRGLGSSLPSGAVGEATIVPSTPEDKEDDDAQAGTGSETKPSVSGDVHAKTFEDGTFSDDVFTITGNISKDKGTVVYDGQTLTKCLKMESATSIKFTAVSAAKLVMVFNDGETKSIKIDGTNTAINNGTLTVDVAAGAHEITKKDSVNLYYIALVYPKAEPVLPEVEAIPSVDGKVDVYDFGAEQLDTEKYVNKLNADIINSWYPGVEAGTKGKNIASFEVKDENDKTVLAFNDGGFPAAHRLRSTNTAITRYDEKSLKNAAGEVAYQGYIYSNKGSTADVNVQVYLEKNDKVTFAVASNGKDSNLGFRAPSGTVDSGYTHTAGSGTASEVTYYAAETGLYTLYSISEKLVVARVMVEHPQDVNVVGLVEAPEALSDYKIAFTCKETGEVIETTPVDGAYNTVLVNGFNYEVSLVGANEYVVTSSKDIKVDGGENNYVQQNIKIDGVKLVTCDVNFVGIPEGALESLDLKFEADSVYAPVIKDGTITLEVGVEYVLTAEGVDDYELTTHTLKASKTLSEAEISFEKKPVYKITIAPNVATVDDLANAKFTFTRHSDADITAEEGYVYRFTGVEGIQLRDGIYTVKVEAEGFTQKLTSNLKVDGADVTKQISFISNNENAPKTWVFTGEDYTGQAQYNGLQIVNGKKHGSQYGMLLGTNGAITIPVSGPSTIKVGVGYSWDLTLGDENYNKPGDAGVDTVEFGYTGAAGIVVIKSSLNGLSSYISSITVIPVTDEEVAIPSSWDFRTDAYTGQADFNGLSIVNGGKHGAQYGMKNTNGSIKVPVKGACDIKVAVGYNWDVTIDGFQGEKYKDKTNGGDITLEYSYTGEAGTVEITTGSEFTSYIKSIELVYPSTGAEDVVLKVGANEKYKTINAALDAVRTMNREAGQRAVIEIQPGDYEEMLVVDVKDVTLKNASATPSTAILNKGVDIDANAVRITSYYGHGYTYYSMGKDCKYDDEILAVNRENGYPSFENPGSGTTAGSYWNATVCIAADGFNAEGIIFENSFNQYVSKKAANDIIVKQSTAKEGATPRAQLPVGSTEVQNKKYVERAAALAMYNNVKQANFDNCKFIGRQDTLYGGTNTTAAFYDCDIYGGTDYIFGGMTAVFAKCNLVANTMEDSNDTFYITAAQQK
ncbi:MAG: hypothetical protein HUJ70_10605, partial [Pseudobutyrivibrio sp.]|nr:hypothetical protein [Pseudobutyrivibrio sp.]